MTLYKSDTKLVYYCSKENKQFTLDLAWSADGIHLWGYLRTSYFVIEGLTKL